MVGKITSGVGGSVSGVVRIASGVGEMISYMGGTNSVMGRINSYVSGIDSGVVGIVRYVSEMFSCEGRIISCVVSKVSDVNKVELISIHVNVTNPNQYHYNFLWIYSRNLINNRFLYNPVKSSTSTLGYISSIDFRQRLIDLNQKD